MSLKRIMKVCGYALLGAVYFRTSSWNHASGIDYAYYPVGMLAALFLVSRFEQPNRRKPLYALVVVVGAISIITRYMYA